MIKYLTVTVDRIDSDGRECQSLIHVGPDGWSQSGENLGETRDLAEAIFDASADELNNEGES